MTRVLSYDTYSTVAKSRSGIWHALRFSGSEAALCGWKPHNFNKKHDVFRQEYSWGFVYEPLPDLRVTCFACLAKGIECAT